MFEQFPYANFHEMNMDWVIKVVKDFLDKYTHIEETIQTGLNDLDQKAEDLQALLQEWYDTHSEDIAEQLRQALADIQQELANSIEEFDTETQQIVERVIQSIPADYSTLATNAIQQRGVRQNEGDTVLTDFDTAIQNRVYTITSMVGVAHAPTTITGTLLNINGDSNFTSGSAQIYLANNGQVFTRICWGGGGGSWSPWQVLYSSMGIREDGTGTVLTDFNEALTNKIYTITDGTGIQNAPTDGAGTLFSFNATSGAYNGAAQVFLSYDGRMFSRICWNNTWTGWRANNTPDPALLLMAIGIRQNEGDTVLTDFNDALANRIYTITSMVGIANAPTQYAGTLLTANGAPSYTNGQFQIFITTENIIYYRIKWNNEWTPWTQTTPFDSQSFYAGIDIFSKFCVIGDSFASGYICTTTEPEGANHFYLAWGRMIARRHGITCNLQSRGGYSTYDFCSQSDPEYNIRGLGRLITETSTPGQANDLYLLCLGINDSNEQKTFGNKQGGLAYLGSPTDINLSDPTQNANSFWGNYGKIIQTIRTNSPTSRVVMCTFCRRPTPATAAAYDSYNQAIREIAAFFSIPCIELTDDPFFRSSYYLDNMQGYHPTAPQYVGYSHAMERLLSKCMVTNYLFFYEWTGMPS